LPSTDDSRCSWSISQKAVLTHLSYQDENLSSAQRAKSAKVTGDERADDHQARKGAKRRLRLNLPRSAIRLTPRTADLLALLFLILLPLLFFWRETLGLVTLAEADAVFWFFPAYKFVAEQLRAGHFPLWNPYLYSGTPLFAQLHAGVLDPLNWIYLLATTSRALTIAQQASFLIALLSTFSYGSSLGLRRRASIIAAIIYALSGFAVARTIYPGLLHIHATVPLMLCFIERLFQKGKWRYVVGGSLVVAWQIFAAHPQPFLYSSLLAASYALFCALLRPNATDRHSFCARFLVQCSVMFVAGLALSAVQWLPAWEFARQSVRQQVPYEFFALFSLHPLTLLSTLFPFFHGQGKGIYQLPFWGPYYHQNEAQIYLGVLALSLAAAGAQRAWRKRQPVGMFWSLAGLTAIVLSLGKYVAPVAWVLYRVPLLGNFRSQNRYWMIVTMAAAMLAAYIVDHLLRSEGGLTARSIRLVATSLTLLAIVIGLLVLWQREMAEKMIRALPDLQQLPEGFLRQAGAEFYLPIISAVCALLALIIFTSTQKRNRRYVLLLALLLIDFHLYAVFAPINNPAKLESLIGKAMPPELASSRDERTPFRSHLMLHPTDGEFNPFWFYGYEMATGYDPLTAVHYKTFTAIDEAGRSHRFMLLDRQDRTLDLLNVRYVLVSPRSLSETASGSLSDPARWREMPVRSPVPAYQDFRVYENLQVCARAWLVSRVTPLPADAQLRLIRGEVTGRTFDPRSEALLEPEVAAAIGKRWLASPDETDSEPDDQPAVSIVKREPTAMVVKAKATKPSMLVVSEVFSPGWQVKVDGREARLWRVNYLLRGVFLEPGQHTIAFVYRPRLLMIGTVISVATVLVLLLVFLWEQQVARRKKWSESYRL
jgi:hypothetical protein